MLLRCDINGVRECGVRMVGWCGGRSNQPTGTGINAIGGIEQTTAQLLWHIKFNYGYLGTKYVCLKIFRKANTQKMFEYRRENVHKSDCPFMDVVK